MSRTDGPVDNGEQLNRGGDGGHAGHGAARGQGLLDGPDETVELHWLLEASGRPVEIRLSDQILGFTPRHQDDGHGFRELLDRVRQVNAMGSGHAHICHDQIRVSIPDDRPSFLGTASRSDRIA